MINGVKTMVLKPQTERRRYREKETVDCQGKEKAKVSIPLLRIRVMSPQVGNLEIMCVYLGWDAGTLNNTLPRGQTGTCNDKTSFFSTEGTMAPSKITTSHRTGFLLVSVDVFSNPFIVNIPEWQLSLPSRPSVHEVEELLNQVAHAWQHHPW